MGTEEHFSDGWSCQHWLEGLEGDFLKSKRPLVLMEFIPLQSAISNKRASQHVLLKRVFPGFWTQPSNIPLSPNSLSWSQLPNPTPLFSLSKYPLGLLELKVFQSAKSFHRRRLPAGCLKASASARRQRDRHRPQGGGGSRLVLSAALVIDIKS